MVHTSRKKYEREADGTLEPEAGTRGPQVLLSRAPASSLVDELGPPARPSKEPGMSLSGQS